MALIVMNGNKGIISTNVIAPLPVTLKIRSAHDILDNVSPESKALKKHFVTVLNSMQSCTQTFVAFVAKFLIEDKRSCILFPIKLLTLTRSA